MNMNPPSTKAAKQRILLVEDHAPNVLVARFFLEDFGYEVDVAGNGIEAVTHAKANHYHAILMDVQMPEMNGYDATRAIRAHEQQHNLPHQPIIGMTANALMGDRERCIESGMDDYLTKPFDPEVFRQKLAQVEKSTT